MDFSIAWNLFTALHCGEKKEILLTHATQPHDWRCGKLHSYTQTTFLPLLCRKREIWAGKASNKTEILRLERQNIEFRLLPTTSGLCLQCQWKEDAGIYCSPWWPRARASRFPQICATTIRYRATMRDSSSPRAKRRAQ